MMVPTRSARCSNSSSANITWPRLTSVDLSDLLILTFIMSIVTNKTGDLVHNNEHYPFFSNHHRRVVHPDGPQHTGHQISQHQPNVVQVNHYLPDHQQPYTVRQHAGDGVVNK